jgi:hypothetical protein
VGIVKNKATSAKPGRKNAQVQFFNVQDQCSRLRCIEVRSRDDSQKCPVGVEGIVSSCIEGAEGGWAVNVRGFCRLPFAVVQLAPAQYGRHGDRILQLCLHARLGKGLWLEEAPSIPLQAAVAIEKRTTGSWTARRLSRRVPKSEKRYSAKTHQLFTTAYCSPPPAVQPTRVLEVLAVAKIGGQTFVLCFNIVLDIGRRDVR